MDVRVCRSRTPSEIIEHVTAGCSRLLIMPIYQVSACLTHSNLPPYNKHQPEAIIETPDIPLYRKISISAP